MLGQYSLLKRLAAGGMGEIWLARQQGPAGFGRLAVIKKILPHLAKSRKFVDMFLDEANVAAQLSHPHIVQIYDLGTSNGIYYIAMEYVHGENMRVIGRRAAQSPAKAVSALLIAKAISQAAEALHYAHTRKDECGVSLGIVHRDVSPQNLILSYEGQIKIVDFGIAKAVGRMTETKPGDLKGKTIYMSPEQIRGMEIDHRSDVFSLGIVLWEMVTGVRLFNHQNEYLVMKAICEEPTPKPSQVRFSVPPGLERIILKALQKKPEARYQSANELHLDMERFLQASSQIVSASHLSKYMLGLFPERAERFSLLEGADKSSDSKLPRGISELFEDPVSDSNEEGKEPLSFSFKEAEQIDAEQRPKPPPLPGRDKRTADDSPIEPDFTSNRRHSRSRSRNKSLKLPDPLPERRGLKDNLEGSLQKRRQQDKQSCLSPKQHAADSTNIEEIEEIEEIDDIDMAQVVDPYAAPPATKKPFFKDLLSPKKNSGDQESASEEIPAKPQHNRRPSTANGYKKSSWDRVRTSAYSFWYSLPGMGRTRTAAGRIMRLLSMICLLAATVWVWDWVARSMTLPLDSGISSRLTKMVRERTAPPSRVLLRVVSHPSGATVIVDGQAIGRTPLSERIAKKETIEVELHMAGHQPWRNRFNRVEEIVEVDVILLPR